VSRNSESGGHTELSGIESGEISKQNLLNNLLARNQQSAESNQQLQGVNSD
jgi:hypothetical protein